MNENEALASKNPEILDIAKNIAKEKGISAEEVLEAMKLPLQKRAELNMVLS